MMMMTHITIIPAATKKMLQPCYIYDILSLALTIAKVCGVAVEEVFYLQEEEDNG